MEVASIRVHERRKPDRETSMHVEVVKSVGMAYDVNAE